MAHTDSYTLCKHIHTRTMYIHHHTAYSIDTTKRSKEHHGHEINLQFANKEKHISINFVRYGEFLPMEKDCVDPNGILKIHSQFRIFVFLHLYFIVFRFVFRLRTMSSFVCVSAPCVWLMLCITRFYYIFFIHFFFI